MKPLNRGAKTTGFHLFKKGKSKEDIFSGSVMNEWASMEEQDRQGFDGAEPGPLDTLLNDM